MRGSGGSQTEDGLAPSEGTDPNLQPRRYHVHGRSILLDMAVLVRYKADVVRIVGFEDFPQCPRAGAANGNPPNNKNHEKIAGLCSRAA